jgi:hypothetical protein
MTANPIAIGMTICDYVIIEEGTEKVSLIGILTKWVAKQFPWTPPQFFVHVALTDGLGEVTIDLVVSRLDTGQELYARRRQIHFVDKLRQLQLIFRIRDLVLPTPGVYQFSLLAAKEWTAQRSIRVLSGEKMP